MKKAISVLTAIMLVMIMGISTTSFAVQSKWYVGDVNRDGSVNAVDASMILQHYALTSIGLPSKIYETAADLNHDGRIDAVDASIVLSYYSASATGKVVVYEIIAEESEYDPKQFVKNDLVEFNGTSWYIHTTMELSNNNLYSKKEFLTNKEVFAIANKYENNWYGIYLDNTKTEVYILISPASLEYFNKAGRVELFNPIVTGTIPAVVTTTTTTTTTVLSTTTVTQLATSTTNVVISSSTETSTTTSSATTTTITTTISCTSIVNTDVPTYSNWQYISFLGDWWNIRASTDVEEDNVIEHIGRSGGFYIKKHIEGDWYEIALSNTNESGKYMRLDYKYLFNPKKVYGTYYFIGESWNVRTSKDLSNSNNIVGQLEFGDLVSVVEYYEDGWAKVICNKIKGYSEMYVVLQPFVRLS